MPHSPVDKRKAITRLRRISGQVVALERVIHNGAECGPVLQQIAALRGAVHGLMSEVLESHLRETFGPFAAALADEDPALEASIDETATLIHRYLK